MISPIGTSNVTPIPQVATASAPSQTTTGIGSEVLHVGSAVARPAPAKMDTENIATKLISEFMRKALATQAYGNMFANGTVFEQAGDAIPKKIAGEVYGFNAYRKLEDLSQRNISTIRDRLGLLTEKEDSLKATILKQKWDFRHQTNFMLDDGKTLNIASNHAQSCRNQAVESRTLSADKVRLSNHDFVFCAVEFSGIGKEKNPLNSKHQSVDFGAYAYVVAEDLPCLQHGYLTLTDHLETTLPDYGHPEHEDFFREFYIARKELSRAVPDGVEFGDAPLFSTSHMKEAVALYLIDFLRKSKDSDFKEFVLTHALNSAEELDCVLNSVFQAEFHVPRILSTRDYSKHILRPMTLEEAVQTNNISELITQVQDKKMAVSALILAIKNKKVDIANYLFESHKWTFDRSDFSNLGCELSGVNRSSLIMHKFLSKELIDVNEKFKGVNDGKTMLNNAMSYGDIEKIAILAEHGAQLKYAVPQLIGQKVINALFKYFDDMDVIEFLKLTLEEDKELYKENPSLVSPEYESTVQKLKDFDLLA